MSRLGTPSNNALSIDQMRLFEAIANGPRGQNGAVVTDSAGDLKPPFNAFMQNPAMGDLLQQLGLAVQSQSSLDARLREFVILSVAARRDCPMEWMVHEGRARDLEATDEQISAIRVGKVYPGASAFEAAVLSIVAGLLDHSPVGDDIYSPLASGDDARTVFDVIVTVGYYDILASIFRIFDL